MMKKVLRSCLMMAVLVSFYWCISISNACAAASDYTANEAEAWASGKIGQHVGYDDGSGYYQCTEFIQAYYSYLGVTPYYGNAGDYATAAAAQPSGWTRTANGTPQKGDILVYSRYSATVQQYGHVAIYISDNLIIDQDGSVYQATVKQENAYYRTYTYNYWGCIHPNFAVGSISFSYESWDKYNEVTETSAHFGVKVYGSVNSATAVGCELYNANKTKIGSCEDGAYRVNDYLIHHYSFASGSADINIQLTPVTGYYYRYYVVANGSKYYSEYYYFKTKGNTYTIAYNANTSASVSNMPGNQTKKQTVSLTLSSNKLPARVTPSRAGPRPLRPPVRNTSPAAATRKTRM